MSYRILQGDVLQRLQDLDDESIHCVVTDPPYHLTSASNKSKGFMGKKWDGGDIAFRPDVWLQCLRVLKPGGHLLAFGGTRTFHRLACAVEDAGFDYRETLSWIYGSGMPKSHNLHGDFEGWGSGLKPAMELIVMARKPMIGTLQKNLEAHGVGALHIDVCRVEGEPVPINKLEQWSGFGQLKNPAYTATVNTLGRWPANVITDGSDEVLEYFPDAPGQCADVKYDEGERKNQNVYGVMKRKHEPSANKSYGDSGVTNFSMKPGLRRLDSGSAARYFYCAKTDRTDRNQGCEELPKGNNHVTVKPTDLMRWLVRLVTPPGGTVLDCFSGSGSTLKAALLEGFECIGIEREEEYVAIAKARCEYVLANDAPLLRRV